MIPTQTFLAHFDWPGVVPTLYLSLVDVITSTDQYPNVAWDPIFRFALLLSWISGPHTALFIIYFVVSQCFSLHVVTVVIILHLRYASFRCVLLFHCLCSHGLLHEGSLLFLSSLNDLHHGCTGWSSLRCDPLLFGSPVVSLLYTYIYRDVYNQSHSHSAFNADCANQR